MISDDFSASCRRSSSSHRSSCRRGAWFSTLGPIHPPRRDVTDVPRTVIQQKGQADKQRIERDAVSAARSALVTAQGEVPLGAAQHGGWSGEHGMGCRVLCFFFGGGGGLLV